MKYLTTIILVAACLAVTLLYACDIKPLSYKPNTFHIRVSCLDAHGQSEEWNYQIEFTNNNWCTSENIMTSFDISNYIFGNKVVMQEFLADNTNTAISIAKKLNTYNKCVHYNDSITVRYNKLLAYRKLHPINKKEVVDSKKDCCKIVNIK